LNSIQSIAVILILIGMLIAFLWKAAFYINLALGLIITSIITYLVHSISGNIQVVGIIFFVGFIGSLIAAALGGFLCLLEGFILSALGFWAYWCTGSSLINIFSSQLIIQSGIASVISTGISATLGNYAFSLRIFKGFSRTKEKRKAEMPPTEQDISKTNESTPQFQQKNSVSIVVPRKRFSSYDTLLKKRILGYIIAYRKVKLDTLATRYNLEKTEIEEIIFEHLADGKVRGKIDPKTETFIVES